MRKTLNILLLLPVLWLGCKGLEEANHPSLVVLFDNEYLLDSEESGVDLMYITKRPEEPGGTVKIHITYHNVGYEDLKITEITLTGSKAFHWTNYYQVSPDSPLVIEPDGARENDSIIYTDTKDAGSAILTIRSNDPDHPKLVIKILPPQEAPKIHVSETSWTFVSATVDNPQSHTFIITNLGKSPLVIRDVHLQQEAPNNQGFEIIKRPPKDTIVQPLGVHQTPMEGEKAEVTVQYTPQGATDYNALVIVSNDPQTPEYVIDLYGKSKPGKITVSYSDQLKGYIDFSEVTNPGESCTKLVIVSNEGEGPVKLRAPSVEGQGDETPEAYTVKWYVGGGSENECTYTPAQGAQELNLTTYDLLPGYTIDVVVTYTAPGGKGVNANLVLKYSTAGGKGEITLPMVGGAPKGQYDIGPVFATGKLLFMTQKGTVQKRTLIVMNRGNGPLNIKSVTVENILPPKETPFSVEGNLSSGTEIPGFSILPIVVKYDASSKETLAEGTLKLVYEDPYTGQDLETDITLEGHSAWGEVQLPTANPGNPSSYANAHVGDTIVLDASGSQPGTFETDESYSYNWFLVSKPAGSTMFLDSSGPARVDFIPDKPGEYEFHLVVITRDPDTGNLYVSPEAVLKVQVTQ